MRCARRVVCHDREKNKRDAINLVSPRGVEIEVV